jgi:hypothetical protein
MDDRVAAAVAANVAWCDLVCRAHGIVSVERPGAWSTTSRSPLYYPDAITLLPDAVDVLEGTEPGAGRSVKDSFATLDLTADGLDVLFDARWIFREPTVPSAGEWTDVDLDEWRLAAEAPDSIRPAAVSSDDVRVLGLVRDGQIVAGAIANRCGAAIGVSNVVAATMDFEAVWATLPGAIAATFGPLPLVGYEQGDDLAAARASGFAEIGPLRVWIANA